MTDLPRMKESGRNVQDYRDLYEAWVEVKAENERLRSWIRLALSIAHFEPELPSDEIERTIEVIASPEANPE
jgi:hypothetical protein